MQEGLAGEERECRLQLIRHFVTSDLDFAYVRFGTVGAGMGSNVKRRLLLGGAVAVAVGGCLLAYLLGRYAVKSGDDTGHVIAAAQDLIKRKLVDPASAVFPPPEDSSWSIRETKSNQWRVMGKYESRDAKGIVHRSNFTIVVRKIGEEYRLDDLSFK
jgi:hypothetical protein